MQQHKCQCTGQCLSSTSTHSTSSQFPPNSSAFRVTIFLSVPPPSILYAFLSSPPPYQPHYCNLQDFTRTILGNLYKSQILRFTLLQLSWVPVFTQAFSYPAFVLCMLRSCIQLEKLSTIYSVLQAATAKKCVRQSCLTSRCPWTLIFWTSRSKTPTFL
jgi:hypothetical protein